MKENLIRNSYLNSFNIDDKSKGLEHLIIINTKCLVDDKIQRYVYIDNNRLKDELRYYNFYGTKPSYDCLLYTSPSPRDGSLSRMPSSA